MLILRPPSIPEAENPHKESLSSWDMNATHCGNAQTFSASSQSRNASPLLSEPRREEDPLKLDAHVHTFHSGNTTIKPLDRIVKESYNSPENLYRLAKARGMDLVTITDHDSISGVLTIADRSDVIIGCEITALFPKDGVRCHIGVLGINEAQHREAQRLRGNALELVKYLRQQEIFSTLNHLASLSAGRMNASHVFSLLPWVEALETRNGTRHPSQNRTASALATAHGKPGVAGSDSHTYRGIGKTYMLCEQASNREEFLVELRRGRVRVGGAEGGFHTMASDILRLTARFYADGIAEVMEKPWRWQRHLRVLCTTAGLPLTAVALIAGYVYGVQEERYNSDLLVDLLASRPAPLSPSPTVRLLEPAV
jgi:predicted metal-dependent phosphoesterase TrpH